MNPNPNPNPKPQEIIELLAEENPDILQADGLEEAIVGTAHHWGANHSRDTVLLYDYQKVIGVLMRRDGMSRDEAEEFADFNILGAYVGEYTPIFCNMYGEMSVATDAN